MIGPEDLKAIDQYVDDPACRVEVKQAVVEFVNAVEMIQHKYAKRKRKDARRTMMGSGGLFELMMKQIRWYCPRPRRF